MTPQKLHFALTSSHCQPRTSSMLISKKLSASGKRRIHPDTPSTALGILRPRPLLINPAKTLPTGPGDAGPASSITAARPPETSTTLFCCNFQLKIVLTSHNAQNTVPGGRRTSLVVLSVSLNPRPSFPSFIQGVAGNGDIVFSCVC